MICKTTLDELAIFERAPAFAEPLHVGRPNLGHRARFMARLEEVLDRRWLTNNGPLVQEFEARIADLLSVQACVAVNSGTTALELLIHALGLSGEVIVPAMTFVATVHALRRNGLTPVFGDIDPVTHLLDPGRLETLITPRTSAILAVHLWGRPCDVPSLTEIARRHRLTLLFDASHAFVCGREGRMIGGFGAAETFSFHATKFIHTMEGGAITTADRSLASRLRKLRNFGFGPGGEVMQFGTNGKMNEVAAAMGLSLLDQREGLVAHNRTIFNQYAQKLRDLPGLRLLDYDHAEPRNYQYIVIEIDEERTKVERDLLLQCLRAENVLVKRYFYPGCHRMAPYRDLAPDPSRCLPETERVLRRVLCLPTGEAVDLASVSAIGAIIRTVLTNGEDLRRRLIARAAA